MSRRRRKGPPVDMIEQALTRAEAAALRLSQAQSALAVETAYLKAARDLAALDRQRQRVLDADQAVHQAAKHLQDCTDTMTLRLRPVHARLSALHQAMLDWAEQYSETMATPWPTAPAPAALDLDPSRN